MIDAALPDLKGIAAMYVFPKFVDIKSGHGRGILVTGIPNMLVETTAEFTFMLMIATAWRLPEQERMLSGKSSGSSTSPWPCSGRGSSTRPWGSWGWGRSGRRWRKRPRGAGCG